MYTLSAILLILSIALHAIIEKKIKYYFPNSVGFWEKFESFNSGKTEIFTVRMWIIFLSFILGISTLADRFGYNWVFNMSLSHLIICSCTSLTYPFIHGGNLTTKDVDIPVTLKLIIEIVSFISAIAGIIGFVLDFVVKI